MPGRLGNREVSQNVKYFLKLGTRTWLVQVYLSVDPQHPYTNLVMMHLEFQLGGWRKDAQNLLAIYSSQISGFQVQ